MRRTLAAVVVVVLAACSGDDSGGSAAETTVTTTTTILAPTPDELATAVCAARRDPGRRRVADPELAEISGLVALPGGLWAHNDSGDEARVFLLDARGQTLAVVRLGGVTAFDWEDMSSAGYEGGELFVGDIGDNEAIRNEVTVYRFALDANAAGEVTVPAEQVQAIALRYPDGPRDAETLMVDPLTRDLIIVHKRFGGPAEVYQVTEDDWSDGDATLEQVGTVEVGESALDAVTAGDIGANGQVVALRTYSGLLVFPRDDDQSVAEALVENEACDAPTAIEVQGETVAFTPDGYTTVSEGDRPALHRFVVTPPEPGA